MTGLDKTSFFMSYKSNYDPPGVDFLDRESGRQSRLIGKRAPLTGWIIARNLDGNWELIRRATSEDLKGIVAEN
jgi:hypothetical protein